MWPQRPLDVHVTNRQKIATDTFDKPYMLISIRNRDYTPAALAKDPNRQATLFIAFDDATLKERRVAKPIRQREARLIWVFFDTYIGWADLLVCQCEAGVARSAAVAASLLQNTDRDDSYCYQSQFHLNYYVKWMMDRMRRRGTRWVDNDEKDKLPATWLDKHPED